MGWGSGVMASAVSPNGQDSRTPSFPEQSALALDVSRKPKGRG